MLIEGVIAIQRIIDQDNIPYSGDGARLPLELSMQPTWQPSEQPIDVSIGAT
jgi:NADH-quinone oxidoreductase subunit B